MENGAISDAQITASTQRDNHVASRARLDTKFAGVKEGGWVSAVEDLNQWLQVDLGSYTTVTRVATQGRKPNLIPLYNYFCVQTYSLQYSTDGENFHFYKESGDNSLKVFQSSFLVANVW